MFRCLIFLLFFYPSADGGTRPLPQCHVSDVFFLLIPAKLATGSPTVEKSIYILYDVNPVEGFNLRRDVYIRLAVFLRKLQLLPGFERTHLVLPPFNRLYHWKSSHIEQDGLFWKSFFDLPSLQAFTSVFDFDDFLDEIGIGSDQVLTVDLVCKLQNFEEMFVNGVFTDKFEFKKCKKEDQYPRLYFNNEMIREEKFTCLKFQGSATLLEKVLRRTLKSNKKWPKIILFLNAEIVLHDFWGNDEFWRARRSMRFSHTLTNIANEFRFINFKSTDDSDFVQRPANWTDEKPYRGAKGGNYICAHIRRADFLSGREKTTPSLKSAANQIKAKLKELNVQKVFISSDCSGFEYQNIKSYLGRTRVYRFKSESIEQKNIIKDGGIAIIDQIICSHARYFIGTYESTFTYRIYEEREILGFPKDTTFNTFCKNEDLSNCERNSIWPIVY